MTSLHISNCRIHNSDATSVSIENGVITALDSEAPASTDTIDAKGALLLPGLIDLYSKANHISSEAKAAAHGGISMMCTSPDSKPMAEAPADIKSILSASEKAGAAQVLPLGTLTSELKGEQLANMHGLIEAGCVALSNGRAPIKNSLVMRRLMEYAATHNITVFLTPQDQALAANGLMHEGPTATRLGLAGIPETAETIALSQQILLAELTGCKVHVSHISCARSVDMIRDAKQREINISADAAIANLLYTDQAVNGYNSCYFVEPPLRSEQDRQALLAGVKEGLLAISSNHKAHEQADKKATFADAETGMSILDTFLPMLMLLQDEGITVTELLNAVTALPAQILNLETGIAIGKPANLVLFNSEDNQSCSEPDFLSCGSNSPVLNQSIRGKVLLTVSNGTIAYQQD